MRPNIILPDSSEAFPYGRPSGGGGERKIPKRDRPQHAAKLASELREVAAQDSAAELRGGTYLRFNSSMGYDLDPDDFDNATSKIQLVNVRRSSGDKPVVTATVFMPQRKSGFFQKKISEYADTNLSTKRGNPKNEPLVESIDEIGPVSVRSLWSGRDEDYPADVPKWCEIWFGTTETCADKLFERFMTWCRDNQVETSGDYLEFPECLVALARLDSTGLELLFDHVAPINEVRLLPEPNYEFPDFESSFQRSLADETAGRVHPTDSNVSICLLDTGLNASHPLLEPAIKDPDDSVLSAEEQWSPSDENGHGTEMAGVALYDDLREALLTSGPVQLHSWLESVKILPPSNDTPKHLYGNVTGDAMAQIEVEHPERKRVYCMAVTDDSKLLDGRPSSWSAKVDELAAGVGQDWDDKRLCLVSAGNVDKNGFRDIPYPEHNILSPVQDPAQAWNALSVGAYSDAVNITQQDLEGYRPVAEKGALCPYSRTSTTWDGSWPIKPEICCDGGNLASNGHGYYTDSDELSRLTTSKDIPRRYYTTTRATSAATAQASWMAGRILESYPDLWPETVRALLVHSARWTDEMKRQFEVEEGQKKSYRTLLRACGWGIPNLDYALGCLDNRVNLVIQGEIQPFAKDGTTKEMRVHELPWPREELLKLGAADAELRVTLSYFIEPNPGDRGWSSKFRYQSCGLRFQVIDRRQSPEDFLKSVSKKMRDGSGDNGGESGAGDWVIGAENRNVGSIHSDFKNLTAAELADARYVAIYPTKGWWAMRKALGKATSKMRYSLIVSIDTPAVEAQLYNEILTQVKMPITITVPGI